MHTRSDAELIRAIGPNFLLNKHIANFCGRRNYGSSHSSVRRSRATSTFTTSTRLTGGYPPDPVDELRT